MTHTLDSLLVWSDGGALDAHIVFLDGDGRVDRHLIVRGVSVRQAQVIVQTLHLQVREDQLQKETQCYATDRSLSQVQTQFRMDGKVCTSLPSGTIHTGDAMVHLHICRFFRFSLLVRRAKGKDKTLCTTELTFYCSASSSGAHFLHLLSCFRVQKGWSRRCLSKSLRLRPNFVSRFVRVDKLGNSAPQPGHVKSILEVPTVSWKNFTAC